MAPRARALLAGLLALLLAPTSECAALWRQERKDQVTWSRNDRLSTVLGTVKKDALDGVEIDAEGKTERMKPEEVEAIVWGEAPAAFHDARALVQRKDWANAVAKYRVAASDSGAREVIRAAAALGAIECTLKWGAEDANQFPACVAACDDFIAEHSSSRSLPRVRWIQARARLLAGQATEAAQDFRSLFEECTRTPPSPGYDADLGIQSGLDAVHAFLQAGDTGSARELLVALEAPISARLGGLDGESGSGAGALRAKLESQQALVRIGEGFCKLVGGQAGNAAAWFLPLAQDLGLPAAARHAAGLGLAQAYAADGKRREAQIWFARVAAIDHTDPDRVAAALLGLAETTIALQDSDANAQARRWLTRIRESYGATPAASRATDLLEKL